MKDLLAETDHENESKERIVKQLTSQVRWNTRWCEIEDKRLNGLYFLKVETLQNELSESKSSAIKYENDYLLLKEEFNNVKTNTGSSSTAANNGKVE